MEQSTEFDLQLAIKQYLSKINKHQLLHQEEQDEVFDHLLTETETLQAEGYSPRDAFDRAIQNFGSVKLISREFERIKPLYTIRQAAIYISLLTFGFLAIANLVYAFSVVSFHLGQELALSETQLIFLDLLLKVSFIGSVVLYLRFRFKRNRQLKVWEMILIPTLGLISPVFTDVLLDIFISPDRTAFNAVSEQLHQNGFILTSFMLISLLAICYMWVLKWFKTKQQADSTAANHSKIKIGILVFFFLALTIFSAIFIISSISIWLASSNILSEGVLKLLDLVLKLGLLWGTLSIIMSRLNRRIFFKKAELILIPIIGFLSPYLLNMAFLSVATPENLKMKIFGYVNFNALMIIGLTVIIVAVTTYLYIFKEWKKYKVSR